MNPTLGDRFLAARCLSLPQRPTGGQHQIQLQTVLWLEANFAGFRARFEFWDAQQVGAEPTYTLNNTMVNVADFTQMYGAYASPYLAGW
jgi:hypothetical protein